MNTEQQQTSPPVVDAETGEVLGYLDEWSDEPSIPVPGDDESISDEAIERILCSVGRRKAEITRLTDRKAAIEKAIESTKNSLASLTDFAQPILRRFAAQRGLFTKEKARYIDLAHGRVSLRHVPMQLTVVDWDKLNSLEDTATLKQGVIVGRGEPKEVYQFNSDLAFAAIPGGALAAIEAMFAGQPSWVNTIVVDGVKITRPHDKVEVKI